MNYLDSSAEKVLYPTMWCYLCLGPLHGQSLVWSNGQWQCSCFRLDKSCQGIRKVRVRAWQYDNDNMAICLARTKCHPAAICSLENKICIVICHCWFLWHIHPIKSMGGHPHPPREFVGQIHKSISYFESSKLKFQHGCNFNCGGFRLDDEQTFNLS